MIINIQEMATDYAKSYADKTRIYFIEKYLSTFNASAGKLMPFLIFPRQKAFLKSLAENKASIAIKHRQAGITTVTSAWAAAQMVFALPESPETILCIGNKLDLSQQLIIKIRDFLLQVPRWYWGDDYYSPDPKSEKNKKDIFVKNSKSELELFNGSKVYARSSGPNAARGISAVSILIFDEAAFIEDGLAVYSSAVAATASVPHSKIVMVSTPNGKDELYYNTYKQALDKQNNYNAVEFKWFQDLRYNKNLSWYKKNEETGELDWIVEDTLDKTGTIKYDEEKWRKLEQDGWIPTSPWYAEMCKSFNNDSMKIAQELDVSFMGSANNVVAPEFIEMQRTLNVREPLEDMKDPMVKETWFWKAPIEGHRYICACIPEGEKILTHRGLVNVENVLASDLLITKEGQKSIIKHKKYRICNNEDIVEIQTYNIFDKLKFTANHPIWSSNQTHRGRMTNGTSYFVHNFTFNDASTLQKDDWLEIPNIYRYNILSKDDMVLKWKEITNSNDNCPILEKDFWWYCGMWLAEGYIKNNANRLITCHHNKEVSIHNRIMTLADNLFNRKARKYQKHTNALEVYFEHKDLYTFLIKTFNVGSHNKHLSEWVKYIPYEYKLQLFHGYWEGDGWNYKNCINVSSASKELINDMQDILFSLGIPCYVKLGKKACQKWICENKKISVCSNNYQLGLGVESTETFFKLLYSNKYENKCVKKYLYFSNDLSTIYIRIKNIDKYTFSGKVFNFETLSSSHTYCSRYLVSHNCDPSRGDAGDNTAIEIIDMDGQDENGMPIVEQVAEYIGKRLGDEIGHIIHTYAKMYNNAFVIIDSTGGIGDTCILTLIQLGYKNIYYEDGSQKTYTVQYSTKPLFSNQDKLPGFHFQGNRFPVLSSFAGMVRNNEIKLRSIRVINELETWIFKGDTGRMDHMSGAHDDSITCLAMGLFVMQHSLSKIQSAKSKDAAILKAYMMNGSQSAIRKPNDSLIMTPNHSLPFYNAKTLNKSSNANGTYLWLFGNTR